MELQSRRARIQLLLCIGVTKWDSARLRPRGVAVALPPVAHNYGRPGCYLSALQRPSRPLSARIQSSPRRRFSTSTQKISVVPLGKSVGSFSIENPTINYFPEKSNRKPSVELQSRRARIRLLLCIGVTFWDRARPRSRGVAVALPPAPHNYGLPGCYLSPLPRPSRPLSASLVSFANRHF